jgi:hypothetical protein
MFTALVAASTAFAIGALVFARAPTTAPRADGGRAAAVAWHPFTQLVLVCTLLLANQILCDAYIVRVHGGDASFIARYLGRGWFAIADGPAIRAIAHHVGEGRWLAPTVLRVQAFLELPFTLFAYLAVARLLGRDVHRTLVRPVFVVGAAVAFTAAFSLVEVALSNPFTRDDLVLRAIAMIVAPLWVIAAARAEGERPEPAPQGLVGLACFLAGTAAIATIVLVVYDAFLLYNLAHLARTGAVLVLVAALAVAAAASTLAPRANALRPSAAMRAIGELFATFTIVFFVPSLALRYWAGHTITAIAGATVIVAAVVAVAHRHRGPQLWRAAIASAVAGAAGTAAGAGALAVLDLPHLPEAGLAVFVLAFLVAALAVASAWSIVGERSRSTDPSQPE